MSLNFFDVSCQEPTIVAAKFGLCDNQDGSRAYTNINDVSKWIATVVNKNNRAIVFTAIDKCVIKDDEEPNRGRCDGMLASTDHIYFVELKDEDKGWITDAINQLESTIQFFRANHDITKYKHKKAFACNRRRKHFHEIDNEFNLKFFRKTNFRIDVQAKIIVL